MTDPIELPNRALAEAAIRETLTAGTIEILTVEAAPPEHDYSVTLRHLQSGAPPRVRSVECGLSWRDPCEVRGRDADSGWTVTLTATSAWRS